MLRQKSEVELALDAIYIRCNPEQQRILQPEFQMLQLFIKRRLNNQDSQNYEISHEDFGYLNGLSDEAKDLVISLVERGDKNLYHSIMAIVNSQVKKKRNIKANQVKQYYKDKYAYRQYVLEYWDLVSEVFDLCWSKYHKK